MKRQIIIHGGGFSYEPKDEWTDDYIVSQVEVKNPQCLFLAHATDDAVRYNEKFYRRWAFRNTRNRTLSLFTPETSDMRSLILESNIIYVGGGNAALLPDMDARFARIHPNGAAPSEQCLFTPDGSKHLLMKGKSDEQN